MSVDVALDARATSRASEGTRAYLRALVERLPRVAPDLRLRAIDVGGPNLGLREQIALPLALARSGARLVHFPTAFAPLRRPRRYVATVHDLIHLRLPQLFGREVALYYRHVAIPFYRGAARLLMGDPRTVDDCARLLGVPPERCRVVPLGYDDALRDDEPPVRAPRPYLLYVGNHRPHKDLATLAAAWAALPAGLPLDLAVTGDPDPALRAHRRADGELLALGRLDAAALRARYRGALAYVQPSLVEGFGIPVLEAAVAGTPVIGSADAVPAIVAPYAATYPAGDARALASLLEAVARDPAAARARAAQGVQDLRAYTWDRFAASTADVYREVLDAPQVP